MSDKKVIDKILEVYKDLFDAEKKVAKYVLNHPKKVVDMVISEVAEETNTSEATIIRFCKKCNFDGFHHLKLQIAKEMINSETFKPSNDINLDNIHQSLFNIYSNKVEELKQTISLIDENVIKEIINKIKNARMVEFAAVGNSIPVILDGVYKFNQIGIPSVTSSIWEDQLSFAYTLTSDDVVIAVSNSGSSKRLITIVDVANNKNAVTICITAHPNSPLAKKCKYVLNAITRDTLFLEEFNFTRISAIFVIEILFLLLTVDKKDSYRWISNHEQAMADDKM